MNYKLIANILFSLSLVGSSAFGMITEEERKCIWLKEIRGTEYIDNTVELANSAYFLKACAVGGFAAGVAVGVVADGPNKFVRRCVDKIASETVCKAIAVGACGLIGSGLSYGMACANGYFFPAETLQIEVCPIKSNAKSPDILTDEDILDEDALCYIAELDCSGTNLEDLGCGDEVKANSKATKIETPIEAPVIQVTEEKNSLPEVVSQENFISPVLSIGESNAPLQPQIVKKKNTQITLSSSILSDTFYRFPMSEAESKLLESEKNPIEGDLFAGRSVVKLQGVLADYKDKMEAFVENYTLYNRAEKEEALYKIEYEKFAPKRSIPPVKTPLSAPKTASGPMKRGGPVTFKQPTSSQVQPAMTEEEEKLQMEKMVVFARFAASKTQRIISTKNLMELLFPNTKNFDEIVKNFDFSNLADYRDVYIAKANEKITAYSQEIDSLKRAPKVKPAETVKSAASIEREKLQNLSKKIINIQGNIKTLNASNNRLEKEFKLLPGQIDKKQNECIKATDNEKFEKLSGEIKTLLSRNNIIPADLKKNEEQSKKAQLNLTVAIFELQKALATEEIDIKSLLKMADVRINELMS